jgi:hypothetical protein
MADLAIIVVVDASLAVGVQRRCDIAALVIVMEAFGAAVCTTMLVASTTTMSAAAVASVRGCNICSAQTKHDCERKNRNRSYDVHDLLLLR